MDWLKDTYDMVMASSSHHMRSRSSWDSALHDLMKLGNTEGAHLRELAREEHGGVIKPIYMGGGGPRQEPFRFSFLLPAHGRNAARVVSPHEDMPVEPITLDGGNHLFRLPNQGFILNTVSHPCKTPACSASIVWSEVYNGGKPFNAVLKELTTASNDVLNHYDAGEWRDFWPRDMIQSVPSEALVNVLEGGGYRIEDYFEAEGIKMTFEEIAAEYPNSIVSVKRGLNDDKHVTAFRDGLNIEDSTTSIFKPGDRDIGRYVNFIAERR